MLINFLPHREWALARKRKKFAVSMAVAALMGLVMAVGLFTWLEQQLMVQREINTVLKQAITAVDVQLKMKAKVNEAIGKLSLRETTLQALQDESQLAAVWLNELVRHLPEGLYVTALKQDGDSVRINGVARSSEEVFALLRQMVREGQWLARPELIEVAATPVSLDALASKGTSRGTPFSMKALLNRHDPQAGAKVRQLASGTD
jgi:type IV pilus assembly protein PilN